MKPSDVERPLSPNGGRRLDPEAAAVLDDWLRRSPVPIHEQPIEITRSSGLVSTELTGKPPQMRRVLDITACDVPVRVYHPDDRNDLPVVVYSHGGGWSLLSIDSADTICRWIAERCACVVVSVGYRLAPEHPFPAAFEDVYGVVDWVASGGLGWTPSRLALAGDSAGGNLSAAVSTHARDVDGPAIDFQVLLYPSLGMSLETPSMRELGPDPRFRLTPETMRWFWRNYFGSDTVVDDPRAVPMSAPKHGLPRTLVVVAGWDPLRDDGRAYGDALAAAGTATEIYEAETLPHGFAMMLGKSAVARKEFFTVLDKVRAGLAGDDAESEPSAAALPAIAAEFRRQPFGRHSDELQKLLHQMRSAPMAGKHFLFMAESQRTWVLGRYSDGPPYEPILDWSTAFDDLEDAEWHVFKIRWHEMFGEELPA